MLKSLSVALVALTLPLAAYAEGHVGVDQLKEQIKTEMGLQGMGDQEIDLDALTDDQIVAISQILDGDDSHQVKEDKIMNIVAGHEMETK